MLDEPLGQFGAFAVGDHPTNDVATKNIQDDVEVVGGPLYRATQLGDVPTPQLVGLGGQQFRLLIRRMGELITAFASWPMPGVDNKLNNGSVLVISRSRRFVSPFLKRYALARSIRCGKSTAHSCGGRYGHLVSAQRSHK